MADPTATALRLVGRYGPLAVLAAGVFGKRWLRARRLRE